jgi:predicted phosphodiesterase
MFTKKDIVARYCREMKDVSTRCLARHIMKMEPNLFASYEVARTCIRTCRGKSGIINRNFSRVPDVAQRPIVPFRIPDGMKYLGDWTPFIIKEKNVLVISDVHIPYHDKKALEIAIADGKKNKVGAVLLNGDFIDCYQLSRFEKDPRKRDFSSELEISKGILKEIKKYLKCPIYFKLGNHDERFEKYVATHAPELLGVAAFSIDVMINNDFINGKAVDNGLNIEIIKKKNIIKIDKLNILHGHEFGKSVFSPVNPARGLFMRGKECALQGHNHQTSQHTETTMNGVIVATWSTGCLCDLHPEYLPLNNWNHGFAIVRQNKDGFLVENKKIINGKIYS